MSLRLLSLLAYLLMAGPALAQPSADARSAANSADHGKWGDARQHAAKSDNPALIKLIDWQYMLDPNSGASFDDIAHFIGVHPDWPEQKRLKMRAEMALRDSTVGDASIIAWFGEATPITGIGKVALARALKRSSMGSQEKVTSLIRNAWRDGDFEEPEEKALLSDYGAMFRQEDHIARADRLLWEEKVSPAKRMLARLPSGHQKLVKARIALIDNKKTSSLLVSQVPESLKDDPGLIFDRMRYRARRDDSQGVREMLKLAPDTVPYPEKWWRFREQQVREAIDERNYRLAAELLAAHGMDSGQGLADATWLKGWLELEFLDTAKIAYETFYRMHSQVRYPVSKARAAYWTARAAEASGDRTTAENWYNTAATFPTTFYGQLASLRRHGTAPLRMPASPQPGNSARQRFESRDLVQAVKLLVELNQPDLAGKLINHLIDTASTAEETALAAELGSQLGHPYLSVRAAKRAMQQPNPVMLLATGYPTPKTPPGIDIERAIALAIIRQESEFDSNAKSSAGALGMMQLRPATAKENARKIRTKYKLDRLYDEDYNITLGSHYLARLIENYDGSYVMAIAAYNAGPGNVRKWVRQFGTPGNGIDRAIDWIEKIPFAETRNYVQRVMENVEVYRHLEGNAPKLQLGEDLTR